jgi:hypothetical protein
MEDHERFRPGRATQSRELQDDELMVSGGLYVKSDNRDPYRCSAEVKSVLETLTK